MIRSFVPAEPGYAEKNREESLDEDRVAAPTLLPWAIKVSLILTAIGVGTSFYLAQNLPGAMTAKRDAQMAAAAGDPMTTGSIPGDRRQNGEAGRRSSGGTMDFRLR
ncbi:hypothetical protein [Methylobacterium marchantiae]|uniref:Uncharacterized protein n=1 Tax=Methylobacterium marchantiae TaxID=600331 RepID=A0ABW3WX36_9HYPH|nr:hypothetical protein AIGOOFII_0049 [Methylobacterium marchantiae]